MANSGIDIQEIHRSKFQRKTTKKEKKIQERLQIKTDSPLERNEDLLQIKEKALKQTAIQTSEVGKNSEQRCQDQK